LNKTTWLGLQTRFTWLGLTANQIYMVRFNCKPDLHG